MAKNMQGIYSPLPQTLSDSESDDKELTMEPVFNNHQSKPVKTSTPIYRQNGHSLHFKNSDSHDDIVKIKRGAKKMSTTRKMAFVASIILCFLPIIIFLWVLPCSETNTCPIKISNWEFQREDVELKGSINLVHGAYKTRYNLAIMYRGSYNTSKQLKNGVLSITGTSGSLAWDFEQFVEPQSMNCSMIDVDLNGVLDCLEADINGLKAIDTASGQALWHAHSEEKDHLIGDLILPVLLPDLNNDRVPDLLTVFKKKKFFVISGQTGKVLTEIRVNPCKNGDIEDLHVCNEDKIHYLCRDGEISELFEISGGDVGKSVVDTNFIIKSIKVKENTASGNVLTVGNRVLTVNNSGNCPKCNTNLTLTDNNNHTITSWFYNNAYIMHPKSFSFGKTKSKMLALKGHNTGFIIQIWQWTDNYQKLTPNSRVHRRSVVVTNINQTYFVREVNARVVLITFNETNVHVINASFIEINQICYQNETNCQPSFENQSDSLLVADLDLDGSKELVNYYSSYVRKGDNWFLTSYLKVLRLEEELPKLYVITK